MFLRSFRGAARAVSLDPAVPGSWHQAPGYERSGLVVLQIRLAA